MSDWIEVEDFNQTWNFEENKEFEGIYVGKEEKIGKHESNKYIFEQDGETIDVWGSTVIDRKMAAIEFGQEVKIIYTGKQGNTKTFKVFHKLPKKKGKMNEDVDPNSIPF